MTKTLVTLLLSLLATSASAQWGWENTTYHYDPLRRTDYKAFCKKVLSRVEPPPFYCDPTMSLSEGTTIECHIQKGMHNSLYYYLCAKDYPQFKN